MNNIKDLMVFVLSNTIVLQGVKTCGLVENVMINT